MATKMTTISRATGKINHLSALLKPQFLPPHAADSDAAVSDLENLIEQRCLSGNLDLDEALGYFETLIQTQPFPSVWSFNHLFSSLHRRSHHSTVVSMYKTAAFRPSFRPEITTMNSLIRCYCALERVDLGFSVLASILKRGLRLSHHTLNILLHELCSRGSVPEAMRMFRVMVEDQYPGQAYSHAIVINGLCKAGETWRAFDLLKETYHGRRVKPDSGCFSPVINGFFREGLVEEALGLFDVMKNLNVSPDASTCNSLIRGLCRCRRWDEADELLIEMQSKHGVAPTTYTYNILLDCLCKGDRTEEAVLVFEAMVRRGVDPDVVTFNSLLSGLTRVGRWSGVSEILAAMGGFGISPNSSTFAPLVGALCKEGRVAEAFGVMEEMTKRGLRPSLFVYNSLIHGLCVSGELGEAIRVFDGMSDQAVTPCVITFNILADSIGRRKVNEALKLLKIMVLKGLMPDSGTRTILKHILARRPRHDKSVVVFNSPRNRVAN